MHELSETLSLATAHACVLCGTLQIITGLLNPKNKISIIFWCYSFR